MPILSQFEAFWQSLQPQLGAMTMLPTEPIGSIPRPASLIAGIQGFEAGRISQAELNALYHAAVQDTIQQLEATGSPVITDGEQAKHSWATYSIYGLENLAPDGVPISFADGHIRIFPRLTAGPFRYKTPADVYLEIAQRYAHVPLKQAVISASALSLLYPQGRLPGYSREQYLDALIAEQEGEIRRCLHKGAHVVQVDFTEGRLSIKLDPTRRLLHSFIDLNNLVLERFSAEERKRIGVHTCPGADRHSAHSADVDYAELLPSLFELQATHFYMQLAGEPDRKRVLKMIREHAKDGQRIFVGVIDPLDPRVETPEEVRDRVLEAAEYIPPDRLGTTDDCGFAPFSDDTSRTRETAFDKIRARVAGTALASKVLGLE
jgi:5-methyltetrahydropteroyltriglutamate--homocysteine methyltransferase